MDVSARHKNATMAPRKIIPLRQVLRGLSVTDAENQLRFMSGKAADIVGKVLQSAVANASHNNFLDKDRLVVRDVVIESGLKMKRWNPASKGMAHAILKRSAHVTVIVGESGDATTPASKPKKKKSEATIETISAVEHLRREAVQVEEKVSQDAAETKNITTGLATPAQSKKEQVHGKMKTMQQGGERAKSHRRKAISEK
jgi:large subunit ribosomal protein L22